MSDETRQAADPIAARLDQVIALLTTIAAVVPASPWMTPADVCRYFRWLDAAGHPSLDVFYQARRRYGLPATRVGGSLRCHRQFLDEWARTGVPVRTIEAIRRREQRPA
jgi:hypothetical protein